MSRLHRWLDPFAALQNLHAFLAARTQTMAATLGHSARPLTNWLGRVRGSYRARRVEKKVGPVRLELEPMDWRNPPSENIAQTALPLAMTAAALAAAVYVAATLEAHDHAAMSGVMASGGRGYDTTPALMPAVTLDTNDHVPGGARAEDPAGPPLVPGRASTVDDAIRAGTAVMDGAGSTMRALADDPVAHSSGGGGSGPTPGSTGATDTSGAGFSGGIVGGVPIAGSPGTGTFGGSNSATGSGATNGTNFFPLSVGGSVPGPGDTSGAPNTGTGATSTQAAIGGSAADANGSDRAGSGDTGAGSVGAPELHPGVRLTADSSQQPVRFVANAGQWGSGIDFVADAGAYRTAIGRDGLTVALSHTAPDSGNGIAEAVRLEWAGVNPAATATGEGRLGSVSNFLVGSDPSQWRTGVAEYSGVRYAGAWDGVDLVYHQGSSGQVEYDLRVQPGASAQGIGFVVRGADARVDDRGRLVLTTASGAELVQDAPTVYQAATDGSRQSVAGAFAVRSDGSIGFTVGAYDPTRELVIDPVLNYTATLNGSATDVAYGVATDGTGNAFVAGYTTSTNFPTTTGAYDQVLGGTQDAFVTKLDPTGTVIWSTYLGGTSGAGGAADEADGVALGADGSVFVTGFTSSNNFPTTVGAYQTGPSLGSITQDAYLAKLSADGTSLVFSSYLGGAGNDHAYAVAVDPNTGQAVVVGSTTKPPFGTDFPTLNAAQSVRGGTADAFVTRFNAAGSALVYSTFLGGSASSAEVGYGVAVDAAGDASVVGTTDSTDFPTTAGAYDQTLGGTTDAFVARYSAAGALKQATLYGGTGADSARAVALDGTGRIYITGSTSSTDLPTVQPVQSSFGGGATDAFVAQFDSLNSAPRYATYQGGTGADVGYGIAADATGRAVAVGTNGSLLTVNRYSASGTAIDWSTTWGTGATGYAAAAGGQTMFAAGSNSGTASAVVLAYSPVPAPLISGFTVDTGVSSNDYLTDNNTPTVTGTSYPGATVTLYRYVPGAPPGTQWSTLGTTTANGSGSWSYTVVSPLTPDGLSYFKATATVGGETSAFGDSVTGGRATYILDTVAPDVRLSIPDGATTFDTRPAVVASASDLWGLAGTVVLDADLNNNGTFTDPGETGFASAVLQNGAATFTGYPVLAVGTTRFRARALDAAGTQGTSPTQSVTVTASPTTWTATSVTPTVRADYGAATGGTASDALGAAGDVTAAQPLALDQSAAPVRGAAPALMYNSQEAAPAPTVQATIQSNNALAAPLSAVGTLTWDGAVSATVTYDVSQLSPGGTWVFGLQPASSLATGRHTYSMSVFVHNPGTGTDVTDTVTGSTFLVNRSSSPYGAGWSFSDTDALVAIAASGSYPAGVLREFGTGGWSFYASNGSGGYISPAGDAGALVAVGGGWTYTGWDGQVLTFNSSGQQTKWTSPDGASAVTYAYDASGGVSTLSSPDGGVATFTYSGGVVATVKAPGSRTTTFTLSAGDLVTVTEPANTTHTFVFAAHRETGETYRGVNLTYSYANGLAQTVRLGTDPVGTVAAGRATGVGVAAVGGEIGIRAGYTAPSGAASNAWYNVFGQPVQTLAPDGGITTVTRDTNGYVTGSTDPLGRSTGFVVNTKGQVTRITQSDGTIATVAYGGANGALSGYTDALGRTWTYTSDSFGRQTSSKDPLGAVTTYSYSNGLLQTVTDALGNVVTNLYDANRRPIGALSGGAVTGTIGYDAAGHPNTFTDALGHTTTATYDGDGRATNFTDPLGGTTTSTYATTGQVLSTTDPNGNVTSYGYDGSGRVVTTIRAFGTGSAERTTNVYDAVGDLVATVDALGNRTTSVFDALNRTVATVDPLGNRTTIQYDTAGEVVRTLDPLGRVTQFGYDALGRPVSTTDALGNIATTVYDAGAHVIATVDPLGHRSTSVYDTAGQMIASVDPLGARTSYGYDASGQQITVTDPNGNVTTTVYDARNRVVATIDALGNYATTVYDAADRAVATVDPLLNRTTSIFDNAGRVVAHEDALGNYTTSVYDSGGRVIATVDPRGNRTTSVFDALNRTVASEDALGNYTTSVYDAADRQIAMVDPLGNRSTSIYDAAGRSVASEDALGNYTTSVYDVAGNVVAREDALGRFTTFTLDALNRVIATTDPLGAVSSVSFDAAGRQVTQTDALGNVTTNVYDDAGRQIGTVDALNNRSTSVFDAAGNTIASIDPLGNRTTSVFDALNRAYVTVDALNNRSTSVFDNAGNQIASVDPLGNRTTSVFDALNRVQATVDALNNRSTSVFDNAGNTIASIDPLGNRTTSVFDALNRAYAHVDALGNRATATFDAAGNTKTSMDALNRTTTFAYDARNMLVKTTDALGNVWTAQYDALGRAWRQIDPNGNDTRTYFDADGRVIQTADQMGNRRSSVFDLAGNQIATVDPLGNRTTAAFDALNRAFVTVDALNNRTTAVFDNAGNMIAQVDPLNNRTTSVFDALNRVQATIDALNNRSTSVFDAAGNTIASIDPLGNRTTSVFDALNRAFVTVDALNNRSTSVFDNAGNQIASVDPLGNRTTSVFDALNRVQATVDALNNRSTSVFDAVGNMIASIDPLNNRSTSVFDALNQQIATVDALNNRTTAVFDAAGNQIAQVDPLNNRTTSVFDTVNRVQATVDALGNRSTSVYDAAGNQIAQVDALNNRTTSVFDALNRVQVTIDALNNRSTSVFDAAGNMTASVDPLGNRTTSVFDALNRAYVHVDALNNRTTAVFDAAGNQIAQVDPLNNRTTSVFDALNRAYVHVDALNNRSTAVFDAAGNMIASVDPLGNRTTSVFDALNRAYVRVDALNNRSTSVFDAAGNMTASIDPLNNRTTSVFDALNRVQVTIDALNNRSTAVFDAAGNMIASVDPLGNRTTSVFDVLNRAYVHVDALNNRSTAVFDAAGNMIASVDPLGNRTTSVFDALNRAYVRVDALNNRSTAVFDAAGNMIASVDPLGNRTTSVYDVLNRAYVTVDALNNRTTAVFDAAGNQIAQQDALGRRTTSVFDALNRAYVNVDALNNRTTSVFDAAGNMVAQQDALGRLSTVVYDALNRAVATVDALGNRSTSVFDAAGNEIATVDALNNRSTSVYDVLNRVYVSVDALGNRATTTFDAAGRAVAHSNERGYTTTSVYDILNRQIATIDALGNYTTTVFDALGRTSATVDALGNRTSYGYDADGRGVTRTDALNFTTTTAYDAAGNVVRQIDALGNTTTTTYDTLNRAVALTRPDGAVSTTVYDAVGNVTTQIDPLGHRTTTAYDALNRVVTQTDPDNATVTSVYDAVGNRTVLVDPDGNRTTTAYDTLNRAVTETDPLNHAATSAYDVLGRLASATDRLGRRIDYGFDALGRTLTEKWYAAGGTLTETHTFTYDADGNQLTAVDPAGAYTLTFDALDRTASAREPYGLTLTFTYDANGNRTAVADSFGGLQTSTYDTLERLSTRSQTGSGGALRVAYTYTARGEQATESRYSDATGTTLIGSTVTTFDAAGRLVHREQRTAAGTAFQSATYTYDAADRLTGAVLNGTPIQTLIYDAADQLLGDGTVTHSYDPAGSQSGTGYTIGAGNQVTSDGTYTYTYDAAGERTQKTQGAAGATWTFTYDFHGHLTEVNQYATLGGALVSRVDYSYDAWGDLIRRVQYDGSLNVVSDQRYGYDGWKTGPGGGTGQSNFDVWADLDGSNALTTRRVFGDRVDELVARVGAGGVAGWYLTDRQGSVIGMIGATGTPTETVSYDGFGHTLSDSAPGTADRYRYTGREADGSAGGLLLMRDRVLAQDLNSFLTRDRMGFGAGDPDLTRYVRNNFPNAADPSGYVDSNALAMCALYSRTHDQAWRDAVGFNSPPPPRGTFAGVGAFFDDVGMVTNYAWNNPGAAIQNFGEGAQEGAQNFVDKANQILAAGRQLWELAEKFGEKKDPVLRALQDAPLRFLGALGQGLKQGFDQFIRVLPDRGLQMVGAWALGISDPTKLNSLGDVADALMDKAGLSGEGLWNLVLAHPKVGRHAAMALKVYTFLDKGLPGLLEKAQMGDPVELIKGTLGQAQDVLIEQAAKRIPAKLLSMLNPTVGTILTAYDVGMKFVENVPRIVDTLTGMIDGVDAILEATPDVDKFANRIQTALEKSVPTMLDFAAGFVGFDPKDIINKAIAKLKKPVADLINKALSAIPLPVPTVHGAPDANSLGKIKFKYKNVEHEFVVDDRNGKVVFRIASAGGSAKGAPGAAGSALEDFRKKLEAALRAATANATGATVNATTVQIAAVLKWAEKELSGTSGPLVEALDGLIVVRDAPGRDGKTECSLRTFLDDGTMLSACFVGGTPLLTPDGVKAIEQFKAGDVVLARSEHDAGGVVEVKVVEEVFVRHSRIMWVTAEGQKIGTTHEHPFWAFERGWVPAELLQVGDRLLGHDGQWIEVQGLLDAGEWATVYNMRIADHHTYFVGCDEWGFSVWAHNANCKYDPACINNGSLVENLRNVVIRTRVERYNSASAVAGSTNLILVEYKDGEHQIWASTNGDEHSETRWIRYMNEQRKGAFDTVANIYSERKPCEYAPFYCYDTLKNECKIPVSRIHWSLTSFTGSGATEIDPVIARYYALPKADRDRILGTTYEKEINT